MQNLTGLSTKLMTFFWPDTFTGNTPISITFYHLQHDRTKKKKTTIIKTILDIQLFIDRDSGI